MSMSHKAYAFDWREFESDELHHLLIAALESGDPTTITKYIEAHHEQIKDPFAGQPIEQRWQATFGNRDVHEYGDFALTRFYDPADDQGIADSWLAVDAALAPHDRSALLGSTLGRPGHEFDPGRQGSYFQTPERVVESLRRIERITRARELESYMQLLSRCAGNGLGVYVTF
ncbi:hypothetical protein NA78x_002793 [Anatilimnocola sp. NA78]|uniref:hypothetical protein n=1 Tax=Anatilimnocola sp. NA78 TaxID=3415683 RepID=UPI003CE53D15